MLQPGIIIGEKYRLETPIGRGGMATVWKASHTTLGRPVAVKFLEAVGAGSKKLAMRFLQEAKIAAALRHRHVVDILDFGVHRDLQPYMVMEFLEGQSLADRYERGIPISDRELLEIVVMALGGLAAVHDAGIIHRDIKPENIFLVEDADGIFAKLLDFGISRGFEQQDGKSGRMTRTGAVVGTPQYMSPEQARGLRDVDKRADLWSVGVVLYEGLSGDVPFDSENPGDVLISVATEEPIPLSDLRPDLPPRLLQIVERSLQKKRVLRFQDARGMREALLGVLVEMAPPDELTHPGLPLRQVMSQLQLSAPEEPAPPRPPPPPPRAELPKRSRESDRESDDEFDAIEVEELPTLGILRPETPAAGQPRSESVKRKVFRPPPRTAPPPLTRSPVPTPLVPVVLDPVPEAPVEVPPPAPPEPEARAPVDTPSPGSAGGAPGPGVLRLGFLLVLLALSAVGFVYFEGQGRMQELGYWPVEAPATAPVRERRLEPGDSVASLRGALEVAASLPTPPAASEQEAVTIDLRDVPDPPTGAPDVLGDAGPPDAGSASSRRRSRRRARRLLRARSRINAP